MIYSLGGRKLISIGLIENDFSEEDKIDENNIYQFLFFILYHL